MSNYISQLYLSILLSQCPSIKGTISVPHWHRYIQTDDFSLYELCYYTSIGNNYSDVIMSAKASQITIAPIVCSTVCSGKLRVTGLSEANPLVISGFPLTYFQLNVSISSRHHVFLPSCGIWMYKYIGSKEKESRWIQIGQIVKIL